MTKAVRWGWIVALVASTGAALVLAKVNHTLVPQATAFARRLQDGGVNLVGSVLNDT